MHSLSSNIIQESQQGISSYVIPWSEIYITCVTVPMNGYILEIKSQPFGCYVIILLMSIYIFSTFLMLSFLLR